MGKPTAVIRDHRVEQFAIVGYLASHKGQVKLIGRQLWVAVEVKSARVRLPFVRVMVLVEGVVAQNLFVIANAQVSAFEVGIVADVIMVEDKTIENVKEHGKQVNEILVALMAITLLIDFVWSVAEVMAVGMLQTNLAVIMLVESGVVLLKSFQNFLHKVILLKMKVDFADTMAIKQLMGERCHMVKYLRFSTILHWKSAIHQKVVKCAITVANKIMKITRNLGFDYYWQTLIL